MYTLLKTYFWGISTVHSHLRFARHSYFLVNSVFGRFVHLHSVEQICTADSGRQLFCGMYGTPCLAMHGSMYGNVRQLAMYGNVRHCLALWHAVSGSTCIARLALDPRSSFYGARTFLCFPRARPDCSHLLCCIVATLCKAIGGERKKSPRDSRGRSGHQMLIVETF